MTDKPYIVSDLTIQRLARLFSRAGLGTHDEETQIGQAMLDLNVRAVNSTRHAGEQVECSPYVHIGWHDISDMEKYRSLVEWLHNSWEGECDDTDLYRQGQAIAADLSAAIVQASDAYLLM